MSAPVNVVLCACEVLGEEETLPWVVHSVLSYQSSFKKTFSYNSWNFGLRGTENSVAADHKLHQWGAKRSS